CSTKKSTAEVFNTILVDSEEGVMPTDPSISLLGSGTDLKVFYAYEKSTGVFLAYSDDCGDSFQLAAQTGSPGANYPSVRARFQGTDRRVDLLYLEQTSEGFELHDLRWTDFQLGAS